MAYYGNSRFQEQVQRELTEWVHHNSKLRNKITAHNLQYLFEYHPNRGLSIDLRRFEPDYYREVFYPPGDKKVYIDEFVRKACIVIHECLRRSGKPDLNMTITVRHMVSEISHWRTFFMDESFNGKTLQPLTEKETDWYYSYGRKPSI